MDTSDLAAREVVVHGRVQGVFFRASCQGEARRRDVAGWVSNEPDGSVRAWFEGRTGDVEAMCAWCRQGPAGAIVERVDVRDRQPQGLDRFEVR